MKTKKVGIITIGDELLIGQVTDTNSTRIGQILGKEGIRVLRKWCVGDRAEEILYALHEAEKMADLILITGGLGPTKDDITVKTLSEYFGAGLVFHEGAFANLSRMLEARHVPVRDMHRQQCVLPSNARLLDNKLGTAPGLLFEEKGKIWVSMPGVPYEMEYILEHGVMPLLRDKGFNQGFSQMTILTAGLGESEIAHRIEPLIEGMPEEISLAYLPSLGSVRLRLSGQSSDPQALANKIRHFGDIIIQELKHHVCGTGDGNVSQMLGQVLRDGKLKICTAESCTGGSISRMIAEIQGASDYFEGAVIGYSVDSKKEILGLNSHILESAGIVSEQTVREMALGACRLFHADLAIATTGYAGPTGGTEESPTGTIWIAAGNEKHMITRRISGGMDRIRNIERASALGLLLAWDWIRQYGKL
jgi:nicotinamide-nucleotide amidase